MEVGDENTWFTECLLMISQDNKFAAVQLYQFVPYTYTPVTSVRYYTGSDAVAVSTFLEKCKTA